MSLLKMRVTTRSVNEKARENEDVPQRDKALKFLVSKWHESFKVCPNWWLLVGK